MLAMRGALNSSLRRLSVSFSSTSNMLSTTVLRAADKGIGTRHLFIQPCWAHHLRSEMFKNFAVDDDQVLVNLNKPPRGIMGQRCNSGGLNCDSLT